MIPSFVNVDQSKISKRRRHDVNVSYEQQGFSQVQGLQGPAAPYRY